MTIFYHLYHNEFYDFNISKIPKNAIEITAEYHKKLFKQQTAKCVIQPEKQDQPVAVDFCFNSRTDYRRK